MTIDEETQSREEQKAREIALGAVEQAKTRLEDGRQEVADRLARAAGDLRDKSPGGPAAPAIERVAKSIESTAGYLHEHETTAIADDVSSYVKLHPMVAISLAAFVGFLLGRLLK